MHNGVEHGTTTVSVVPTLPADPPREHTTASPLHDGNAAVKTFARGEDVTHIFIGNDGDCWCDDAAWHTGHRPTKTDFAWVPDGKTVLWDEHAGQMAGTIRNNGTIRLKRGVDIDFQFETLFIDHNGTLDAGTEADPYLNKFNGKLLDTGSSQDRRLRGDLIDQSGGIVSMGDVLIHGAKKTEWLNISTDHDPLSGQSTLTLASAPLGWSVGDELLIAGTTPLANQDERRKVLEVKGNVVTLDAPLGYDHKAILQVANTLQGKQVLRRIPAPVGNLTRNITFRSENPDGEHRGHLMIMRHEPVSGHVEVPINVSYAAFVDMGRTDKSRPIVDSGATVPLTTALNTRARYPLHFHRNGSNGQASMVVGCVVDGSPGWGMVNHSSYAHLARNIATNCFGSCFSCEVGNEVGSFMDNLAIRSTGANLGRGNMQGEENPTRRAIQDYGHEGYGFWAQGLGCAFAGNVAFGHTAAGYGFFNDPMTKERTATYNTALTDARYVPTIPATTGLKMVNHNQIPMRFKGNVAAACGSGIETWFFGGQAYVSDDIRMGLIEDFVGGASKYSAVFRNYSHLTHRGCAYFDAPELMTGDGGVGTQFISDVMENCVVTQCKTGWAGASGLKNRISGGLWDNAVNIYPMTPQVHIEGDPKTMFGTSAGVDIANPFNTPQPLEARQIFFNGRRLYHPQQAPAGCTDGRELGLRLKGFVLAPTTTPQPPAPTPLEVAQAKVAQLTREKAETQRVENETAAEYARLTQAAKDAAAAKSAGYARKTAAAKADSAKDRELAAAKAALLKLQKAAP